MGPPQGKRQRLFGALGLRRFWLTLFEGLKRLGGDEERIGCSVLQLASNGIVKTSSYIRPLALLTLGNVLPSEAKAELYSSMFRAIPAISRAHRRGLRAFIGWSYKCDAAVALPNF